MKAQDSNEVIEEPVAISPGVTQQHQEQHKVREHSSDTHVHELPLMAEDIRKKHPTEWPLLKDLLPFLPFIPLEGTAVEKHRDSASSSAILGDSDQRSITSQHTAPVTSGPCIQHNCKHRPDNELCLICQFYQRPQCEVKDAPNFGTTSVSVMEKNRQRRMEKKKNVKNVEKVMNRRMKKNKNVKCTVYFQKLPNSMQQVDFEKKLKEEGFKFSRVMFVYKYVDENGDEWTTMNKDETKTTQVKGQAYCRFVTEAEAQRAIEAFHGEEWKEDLELFVWWATTEMRLY